MIRWLPWHQVSSEPRRAALPHFGWQRSDDVSAARDTAALMLYVALVFMQEEPQDESALAGLPSLQKFRVSAATYDALARATDLSRTLISQGLTRLAELQLVQPLGSAQKRRYVIPWSGNHWFKLPCRAIVRDNVIVPFGHFSLRSKRELHAMKLYLYLASVRDRSKAYAEANYETIHARLLIPERDIRRAISHLINVGLLRDVQRDGNHVDGSWGSNRYHLAGDRDLFAGRARPSDDTAEPSAAPTEAATG